MMKRLMHLALVLVCLCMPALAGGKETNLVQQAGAYEPRYSVNSTFEVLPGTDFELLVYEDSGTQQLMAVPNGEGLPLGVSAQTRVRDGKRQIILRGLVYAEGSYDFSLLVQEVAKEGGEAASSTLAILQVRLRVTADAKTVEPYIGDGRGMLRLTKKGVNFRRTPGGTRLDSYDAGTRFVWCDTQKKGGYTWYLVWSEEHGYGYVRGDTVQVEPPLRIVYTPGKETAFTLFITPGVDEPLTPSLIMTEAPEEIGFDTEPLVNVTRGGDTWTLLCFSIAEEKAFWIKADLRDEHGAPLECQLIYLTTRWEEPPVYVEQ